MPIPPFRGDGQKYLNWKDRKNNFHIRLNKGEAINALARVLFFGKHGMIYEKDIQGQIQRATALSMIIYSIILWNTLYLPKAIEKLKKQKKLINYI